MTPPESQDPVEGRINKAGHVLCTCGKKVGQATETTVEFYCRDCKVNVVINAQVMILRNCEASIRTIENGIAALQNITSLMQSIQSKNGGISLPEVA